MDMMFIITNTKINEQAILISRTQEGALTTLKFIRPEWDKQDLLVHAVLAGTVIFRKI